jgi:hypothetical protein
MDSADRPATEQRTGTPETGPDGFRGPTPAGGDGAAQPGYRAGGENGNGNWSSWWTRATPGQAADPYPQQPAQPAPEPQPEPNGSTPAGPEPTDPSRPVPTDPSRPDPSPLPEPRPPADEGPQLHRRVPQANLAAGLRRESEQAAPEQIPVVRDPMAARNALSRFQAAQRAARDVVDGDQPEGGPPR